MRKKQHSRPHLLLLPHLPPTSQRKSHAPWSPARNLLPPLLQLPLPQHPLPPPLHLLPPLPHRPAHLQRRAPPPLPPRELKTRDRVLLSADLILSTIDDSTRQLIEAGVVNFGKVMGHRCVYLGVAASCPSLPLFSGMAKTLVRRRLWPRARRRMSGLCTSTCPASGGALSSRGRGSTTSRASSAGSPKRTRRRSAKNGRVPRLPWFCVRWMNWTVG